MPVEMVNPDEITTPEIVLQTTIDPAYLRYLPVPLPVALRWFFIALCFVGFIVGSFGNILVILAIAHARKLRTTANALLSSLAVADLCTCFILLPIVATGLISLEIVITNQLLCRLFYFATLTFSPVSIQHLILIAANRYTLINKKPITYFTLFNKRTISVGLTSIWVANLLLNIAVSMTSYGTVGYYGKDYCYLEQKNTQGVIYWVFTMFYSFISCFIVIPVFYVLTFRTVYRSRIRVTVTNENNSISMQETWPPHTTPPNGAHESVDRAVPVESSTNGRQQRKLLSTSEIKLTIVNFIIFITNLLFLSPLFFSLIVTGGRVTHGVFNLILFSICMNSVVNPLVYCGFNRNFRHAFKVLLRI